MHGAEAQHGDTGQGIRQSHARTGCRSDTERVPASGASGRAGDFLPSRWQDARRITENLNALNSLGYHPWELSFSYGRALQEPAQKAWAGKLENAGAAQEAMKKRARLNGLARSGDYSPAMENEG